MTLELLSVEVRSPRRIRLRYSLALAAGAFSVSWFSITCADSSTGDPLVSAALLVPSDSAQLELALGIDLAPGAQYTLTSAANIPGVGGALSALDVTSFRPPQSRQAPSPSVSSDDVRALLFGEDLAHNGSDLVETADGDLAIVSGPENAMNAVVRRALADGLPYNQDYGPHLRKFVDAPSPTVRAARGSIERQARLDDRVKGVQATVRPDDNSGDITIDATVQLIGGVKRSFSERVV